MDQQRKAVVVTRHTRLEELVAQYNTEAQAQFVVDSRGDDFEQYRREHRRYYESLAQVEAALRDRVRVQRLERSYLANFIFGPDDLIVVIGQDGLVANTLKYIKGQPVIAINPDPASVDGILLPFEVGDTAAIVKDVMAQRFNSRDITMARASLNDGQSLLAVNDLYIGPLLPTSARYQLTVGERSELQSSSGIIVSTGLGSTGWMTSIRAGAAGVMGANNHDKVSVPWDADYLTFAVREPFPSQTTGVDIVFGRVDHSQPMTISSRMPSNGVIFSDGMVDDRLWFNSGSEAVISLAETRGCLVV